MIPEALLIQKISIYEQKIIYFVKVNKWLY